MNAETFFKSMYFDIWQGNSIEKLSDYYSESFQEIVDFTDENNEAITESLDYQDLIQRSRFKKENYKNTTLDIKRFVACKNTITVYFYSNSIDKSTDELIQRRVCGIWQLDEDNKIDKVWAVATRSITAQK
ncbi:MAG: hypothetical protein P1U63_00015 [Coxiellaceae bacterium]|nr:hypothetical protein [Coxiellaceae bacterium]